MSTTTPYTPRKAYRDSQDVILGGVAAGLAHHLGLSVLSVRVAFVVLTLAGFIGPFLYAGLWMVLPAGDRFETATAPGLESATRGGLRQGRRRRFTDAGTAIALGALGVGVVFVLQALFGHLGVFWPALLAVGGLALLWRQADEAQRQRWRQVGGRVPTFRMVLGDGWASWLRLGVGLLLLIGAGVIVWLDLGASDGSQGLGSVTATALLVFAGLAVVVAPSLRRMADDLSAEREQRIRTEERADVAAHLHDSVLQTLALIQRNSHDPQTVARLARSQERELRSWLYSGETRDPATVAGALRETAARVEDDHGVSVDVVAVGDTEYGEELRPIVSAAGEAITNAAKHAGTGRVDVYAEIGSSAVDVFVRDRGAGFHPDGIPEDRHGVRSSIMERMSRHGGRAEVISAPGEGTEVRLHLPYDVAAPAAPEKEQTDE